MQDALRQEAAHRGPQQALFLSAQFPQLRRHVVQILRDAPVAEGDPDLQRTPHAHPVLPVQQGLHEPVRVQPHETADPLLLIGVAVQALRLPQRGAVTLADDVPGVQPLCVLRRQEGGPPGGGLGPGEAVFRPDRRVPEPGIAAEDLVGALAGHRHGHVFPDGLTEQQQGGVHVRHARQVPGLRRRVQGGGRLGRVQHHVGVERPQIVRHFRDVRAIGGGLELSGGEVAVVVPVVHGEGPKLLTLFSQGFRRHGGDDAGIQPAGEEGADGHVADQLPPDGVFHQIPDVGHGVRLVLLMGPGGEGPVFFQPQAVPAEGPALAGQEFMDIAENALSRRPPRADEDQLRHAALIDLRRHRRVFEQGLELRGEHQPAPGRQGEEQGLDAHPVPGQEQRLRLRLPDGEGEDAVEPLHAVLAPLQIGFQQHLGVRVAGKAPARRRQLPPQVLRVVELSVVYQCTGPVLPAGRHGLAAVHRVNDAQPRVGQLRVGGEKQPLLVRPPPPQGRLHLHNGLRLRPKVLGIFDLPGNAAHGEHLLQNAGEPTPSVSSPALFQCMHRGMTGVRQNDNVEWQKDI